MARIDELIARLYKSYELVYVEYGYRPCRLACGGVFVSNAETGAMNEFH